MPDIKEITEPLLANNTELAPSESKKKVIKTLSPEVTEPMIRSVTLHPEKRIQYLHAILRLMNGPIVSKNGRTLPTIPVACMIEILRFLNTLGTHKKAKIPKILCWVSPLVGSAMGGAAMLCTAPSLIIFGGEFAMGFSLATGFITCMHHSKPDKPENECFFDCDIVSKTCPRHAYLLIDPENMSAYRDFYKNEESKESNTENSVEPSTVEMNTMERG